MRSKLPVASVISSTAAALLLAGIVWAVDYTQPDQQTPQSQNTPPVATEAPASSSKHLSKTVGKITAIDPDAGTVTIKGWLFSKTLRADASTLQGMNVGDKVVAHYHQQDGVLVAEQILNPAQSSRYGNNPSQPATEPLRSTPEPTTPEITPPVQPKSDTETERSKPDLPATESTTPAPSTEQP